MRENVRIFKGIGTCLVYHFGSITTRKKDKNSSHTLVVKEIKFLKNGE